MRRRLVALLLCLSLPGTAMAHRLEPIGTELPNVLETGRLVTELGFDFVGFDNRSTAQFEAPLGVEFSFIKNLQLGLEIPFISRLDASATGVGDMKVGGHYQWLQESSHHLNLSTGLEVTLPTGSEVNGLSKGVGGFEMGINLGRWWLDRFHLMGNLGYGVTTLNTAGEREQEIVLRQALVTRLFRNTIYLTEEFQYQPEFHSGPGVTGIEKHQSVQFSPGLIVAIRHGVEWKTSFPIGLAAADPNISWRSQLSVTFGEPGLMN